MTVPPSRPRSLEILLGLAAFVIVIAGLRVSSNIVVPFLLSLFIAIICAPALQWLQRHRVPTLLALIIVIGALFAVGLGVLGLVGTSLTEFTANLPGYQTRLRDQTEHVLLWLQEHGLEEAEDVVRNYLDPGAAMRFVANLLSGFGSALTNGFLILIAAVFLLLEATVFQDKLRALARGSDTSLPRIHQTMENIRRYMFLKTALSLLTGVLIWLWLVLIGVDFPMLWGLLAFLLNFIPNIGSVIAAVPAVLLALIQLGPGSALWTGVGYLVANTVIGNFIEPRVMGRDMDLSTLVVFVSLVFWGWVLGPVGMLLSVPLTMTTRIMLESSPETRWLAVLLAARPPADQSPPGDAAPP